MIIGGYAVGYYGYPRPTGDMDVWIARTPDNVENVVNALREFGFTCPRELLLEEKKVVRMGVPPFRLEILTTISGVDFLACYAERLQVVLDEIEVSLIRSVVSLEGEQESKRKIKGHYRSRESAMSIGFRES